ncbi:hypothetical protein CXF86_19545 [Shewanella sp. GutCb]|uniref:TniQ family protein n=1 Tax=Shewanella sp. GutCb TaxID=2058315 RepID=UPI000C7C2316|nr:TniQ family protein [Shewanella sp. GutCb]PKG73072.1 hypothetical protein CXF86_19545 [Shewanella sp. GutCb]
MVAASGVLGVRPYRLATESLSGYLLRLAYLNGFHGLSDFLWTIGARPVKNRRLNYFTPKEVDVLAPCLAKVLGRDATQALTDSYATSWQFDSNRLFQHSQVDFPRLCISCLQTQPTPHLDWRWQCGFLPFCQKHHTPLYNNCPQCHAPISWHTAWLEGCPKCGLSWQQFSEKPHNQFMSFNKAVCPCEDGSLPLDKSKLHDVMLALMVAGRPFDVLHQPLIAVPENPNHWAYALRGLRLLFDQDYYHRWSIEARSHWPHSEITPVAVIKQELLFSDWPALTRENTNPAPNALELSHDSVPVEAINYVKPSRAKAALYTLESNWYSHLSHQQLAASLGITTRALMHITETNLLPQLNSTSVVRDKLFEANKINDFIKKKTAEPHITSMVPISENNSYLRRHLTEFGELLCSALRDDIQICVPEPYSLAEIQVNSAELETFLNVCFDKACEAPLGLTRVAKALGVPSPKVEELVRQGHFHYAAWRNDRSIDGLSFRAFYTPKTLSG